MEQHLFAVDESAQVHSAIYETQLMMSRRTDVRVSPCCRSDDLASSTSIDTRESRLLEKRYAATEAIPARMILLTLGLRFHLYSASRHRPPIG
jgi:hypothetical protein